VESNREQLQIEGRERFDLVTKDYPSHEDSAVKHGAVYRCIRKDGVTEYANASIPGAKCVGLFVYGKTE
jgi:hypothetical protein